MTREIGDRKRIVCRAINEIGRKRAAHRVAPSIRQLGLQNAGRAGADKHTNALRAVFRDGGADRFGETILKQPKQSEPIIAAIEIGQVRGQLHRIHARHFAYMGRQLHGIERARRESGTALTQCIQRLVKAATDTAGGGEMGEPNWVQSKVSLSKQRGSYHKIDGERPEREAAIMKDGSPCRRG